MEFAIFAVSFTLIVAATALWAWALIDCIKNESSIGNDRIVWLLLILFLNLIGSLLYIGVRRPARIAQCGR